MNRDQLRRLVALEEQAEKGFASAAGVGGGANGVRPGKPSPGEMVRALEKDLKELEAGRWANHYRELFYSYGWSDEDIEARRAHERVVRRRVEESDYEDWEVVRDRLAWIDARGGDMDEWDTYPGPSPTHWEGPGSGGGGRRWLNADT